jgi:DNA-binding NarL/FixJ family response regulator
MSNAVRVVLVDDHPLFREGVAHALRLDQGIDVIGQGESAVDALALTRELAPDVLLLDLDMPGGGLSVVATAIEASPKTRVVVLTASDNDDDAMAAFRAGVSGYILKGVPARELIAILHKIHAGQGYVPPSLGAVILKGLSSPPVPPQEEVSPLDDLTSREQQILGLIAAGRSNKEIGLKLGLTEKTVKYYVSNILLKLQVRNRVEAALLAQRLQLDEK